MRVLITRPDNRAHGTAEKLIELGHEPVHMPLFRPRHDPQSARQALKVPHSCIALTSAEAVRCLAELGDDLADHRDTIVFAVGKGTARMAEHVGFTNIITASGGGEQLGAVIAEHYRDTGVPNEAVLYLAGARRAGFLEKALASHGIACAAAAVYQMEKIDYPIEQQQALLVNKPLEGVFLYSHETALAFFDLPVFATSADALKKTLFFCLSRNIAEAVPEEFRNSAVVSMNPDEDELIDLL